MATDAKQVHLMHLVAGSRLRPRCPLPISCSKRSIDLRKDAVYDTNMLDDRQPRVDTSTALRLAGVGSVVPQPFEEQQRQALIDPGAISFPHHPLRVPRFSIAAAVRTKGQVQRRGWRQASEGCLCSVC